MKLKKLAIKVSDTLGEVDAELLAGEDMNLLFVLAHGAGAGMNHPFMVRLSEELAVRRIGTLRYNFPYVQKGAKRPDVPAVAEKTVAAAAETAGRLFPGLPIVAGGKSFGGRMSSQWLSKGGAPGIRGVVFVGFPLHAPGKPGTERAGHLQSIVKPMLFLQGTRDALAAIGLIREVCDALPAATLAVFEGADHSFKAGKADLIPSLAGTIADWSTQAGIAAR